jgi:hypothetical protein
MSDIERIPSMRKPARQGVPRPKPRDPVRPARGGETREAPRVEPKAAAKPALESEAAAKPAVEPTPPPEPESEPRWAFEAEPAAVPEPTPAEPTPAEPTAPEATPPITVRQMLARVDGAWSVFRAAAFGYPAEHLDDHLSDDGWTRKQMLAHIAVWHDLTSDRLVQLALSGRPVPLDRDTDAVNAAAARVAIGKTAGEVRRDLDATFNRLRRQMQRLTDGQLRLGDAWAARVIADNTYEHYVEHMADLVPPEPPPGSGARR